MRTPTLPVVALASLAMAFHAPLAAAQPAGAPVPPAFRLPDGARPTAYAATLTVVPGATSVAGDIAIDVELARPHPVLWLNADAVTVERAVVDGDATRARVIAGHDQFVGLAFDPPLATGAHRLELAFAAGQSTNATRGIFTLEENGASYTMTQFEALSARRAFPCFDEPGFKTPWQLTLRVPRDAVAVSNTLVEQETVGDDGFKTVRFARTSPLPTYLVAFAVGPWEIVDLGRLGARGTPTRIIVPKGRAAEAAFAAASYPDLFVALERWFGIPYPFDKLDHIAIPLTVGFAMENAGLIAYGMPILLAKPGEASPRFRRVSANVGAHEIAHQWFGNLVTTAWWDDIWLNEAFATWIAEKTVDRWRPDYDRGAARIEARAEAMDADALASARRIREPVVARGDVANAFDHITYEKGATVIGMFESWIGEEPFRLGVRDYLESRRWGSATSADFLAAQSRSSLRPVAAAFDSFLNQGGIPLVETRLSCGKGGARLDLHQRRLTLVGAAPAAPQRWQIPVCARVGGNGSSKRFCTLLATETASVPLGGACPEFVLANAGGTGYYVPDYRDGALERLERHRRALTPAEFASVLDDLRALVRAGSVSHAQAMRWVRLGAAHRDRHVVRAAVDLARFEGRMGVADDDRPAFEALVRDAFAPRARKLGFVPKADESDDDQLLRRTLLRFAAPYDPALAAAARRLALAWVKDRKAIAPGLVDVTLVTAARTGDAAEFDALAEAARSTADREERRHLMLALLSFGDPGLAQRGLALLLDPAFDVRESWTALGAASEWSPERRAPHDFIVANFDALAKSVSPYAPAHWPAYAQALCSSRDRAAVEAFWRPRLARYEGAERELAMALEAIDVCRRLRPGAS
jgi:alanyl aminopeptidase